MIKIKLIDFASEKEIEKSILKFLELRGLGVWKTNNGCFKVGNRFIKNFTDSNNDAISGIPDIMGYLPNGKALYIEVKKKGKYPTKEQKNFLKNAQENKCCAFVARSIDDVILHLKQFGYDFS